METVPGSIRFYRGVGSTEHGRLVIEEAVEAALHALRDGAAKGHGASWTQKSPDFHVHRAALHVIKSEAPEGMTQAERRHHLQHALCRIAMALVIDRFQVKATAWGLPPRPTDYAEAA